ncbi:MAG: GntR family transcriptional regulator [Pelagibacterales bacterium]|nr:GntR family transcriptional regulator [Pelagibacterales bacterium]|tara:strand:- start:5 stop:775 length:771 start_codon:yes stop_codon:yes gene_type:complete
MVLSQIGNKSVYYSALRQLEKLIVDGIYKPNEKLPSERDIALQLKISRPNIRIALKELERKKLVITKKGDGTFVNNFLGDGINKPLMHLLAHHSKPAIDFMEFRYAVEGEAAYQATIRATKYDKQILKEIMNKMTAAHKHEDPDEEASMDINFHIAIAEASHNILQLHIMKSLFSLLNDGIFFNRNVLYFRTGSRSSLLKHHHEIYNNIIKGNPEKAKKVMQEHVDYAKQGIIELGDISEREKISKKRLEKFQQSK